MPTLKNHAPRRPWQPERKPQARQSENRDVYNSARWQKLRARHKAENPLCVECERLGLVEAVEVTDHIVPINEGGSAWDWKNLQSLCGRCHDKKSASEGHRKRYGGNE